MIQIDGSLPNLALMRLAAHFRAIGQPFDFTHRVGRELFDPRPEHVQVYASTIFEFSAEKIRQLKSAWRGAVIGGTGVSRTVNLDDHFLAVGQRLDYSIYPEFAPSIGFTQRGCRLACDFCVVGEKEGKNRTEATIAEIWRGGDHPKKIVLLDNDLFGQPRPAWRARIRELIDGRFKVNINQGFNVRLIDQESAEAIAQLRYYEVRFKNRILHTAWDNVGHERIFFRGVQKLFAAKIPPAHVRAYMLVGFDKAETWERIFYRLNTIQAAGMSAYPMVYAQERRDLKRFQRWVVNRYQKVVPWKDFKNGKSGKLWAKIDSGIPER